MNQQSQPERYHPREVARRTGVTVRALHYYDQLGLLKPSGRTAAGYRLYAVTDFARLQQIVTLKFIGFPLRDIKKLLAGANLAAALRLQRKTLEQKRRQLDQAIAALAQAERALGHCQTPDGQAFAKIIEAIQMQKNTDWTRKYYSDEAQKLLAERGHLWSPELQKQIEEKWTTLLKDIESAASDGLDPANPAALTLAERHAELIAAFTGGHSSVEQGLAKLWADRSQWPKEFERQVFGPFAKSGVAAAQGDAPTLLSDSASKFLNQALAEKARRR